MKIDPANIVGGLAAIDALWERLVPNAARRRFADEYFNDAYAQFVRVNRIFVALAMTAATIAAMGLFAMALLAASRRVHEIGVRQTLGATVLVAWLAVGGQTLRASRVQPARVLRHE